MSGSPELFENRLRAAAQQLPYPPTPDIAGAVRQRLAASGMGTPHPAGARRRWQTAFALTALLLLLLAAGSLAVPSVRAAVAEFIQLGVMRIFLPEPTPTPVPASSSTPGPTLTPATTATPPDLISLEELSGESTLQEATLHASFTLHLPAYPLELGKPDRVFMQDMNGDMLILVWTAPDDLRRAALVLYQIAAGSWAGEKGRLSRVEFTSVNGREAVWAEGPYALLLTNRDLDIRRLIAGRVLIWEQGGITYRLESSLSLSEAIQIAESLEPYP